MKNLTLTFLLLSLAAVLSSCSSASLKVANKPVSSNGKSEGSSYSGEKLTLMQKHQQYRQNFVGIR